MRIAEDIIIDCARLPKYKVLVVTRETWKAGKVKDEVWGAIRNYSLDKKVVDSWTPDYYGYIIYFNNDSVVKIASMEDGGTFKGLEADQVYYYKGDEFSTQEKLVYFAPLLAKSNLPVKDRLVEV